MSVTVRFGNLSASQFSSKFTVDLSDDDTSWLEENRESNAQNAVADKLHIFDAPLGIVAGSEIVHEVIERLRKYNFDRQFYVQEWL